jgi:hypothetical protein
MELDFSKQINLQKPEGFEETITNEAWAAEKTKGKKLNKPFRTSGGPKKFSVYVKNEKGNVVKVNFGDPNMEIKRDDPARRKSFRARHNCENPGPKWKARYWSCKMWSKKSVTNVTKGSEISDDELIELLDESEAELSKEQKKLPPALQKKIEEKKKKKKSGDKKDSDKKSSEKQEDENSEAMCEDDHEESDASKPGLWENIRKKKKRMGKDYKPAKPGDKDYPDPKALKKAQESSKKKKED